MNVLWQLMVAIGVMLPVLVWSVRPFRRHRRDGTWDWVELKYILAVVGLALVVVALIEKRLL